MNIEKIKPAKKTIFKRTLSQADPALFSLLTQETDRQETQINLIASENYVSGAVLEATASTMTNKYAEGIPSKRYYGGCEFVDKAENLAIERCKQLFNAEHVNVQPHAGSQANMAVYFAILKPGDTVLGMSLSAGGHLTHGHPLNFSGQLYNFIPYSVDPDSECIDYDQLEKLAEEHKPKLIIAGASAYSRIIDFKQIGAIAKKVNAYSMADIAHIAGLVATGNHPSPIAHMDFVTSTTHKTLRGPRGAIVMCKKEFGELLDKAIMPGMQGGPLMHAIAAKAVAFHEALQPEFADYQKQVIKNAQATCAAFIALGYRMVAGGTDNHLCIVDLRAKNITGRQAEVALEKAGITVSRSCIPFDTQKPWITSGIRIGTPAITTRGMGIKEVSTIVHMIDQVITNHTDEGFLQRIKQQAKELCEQFPIYD